MNRSHQKANVSKLTLCTILVVLVFAVACNQPGAADTRSADEAAIRALDAQWSQAAIARDVEAATSYYADDASMLPPNAPIVTGKPAIRAVWTAMLVPEVTVSWQLSKVEVARSGDLAYLVGSYQETAKGPQGSAVADRGKLVEVWKKQSDGKWKVVADIFNSDLPLPPPSGKKGN